MASALMKPGCAKCDKGGGIAMCNGCHQSFCTRHFSEHRQELSVQIENIGQEHDLLRRDVNGEKHVQSALERINQWEQESIRIIQDNARKARVDLQQLLERQKKEINMSVNKLTEELLAGRESDDYTEVDLNQWNQRLIELRRMIDSSTMVNIDYDHNARAALSLITVAVSSPQLSTPTLRTPDRGSNRGSANPLASTGSTIFDDIHGAVTLLADRSTALCSEFRWNGSCVTTTGRYSSRRHPIRFRVDKRNSLYLFFGIVTASQALSARITESGSAYGWWEFDFTVINGKTADRGQNRMINSGDEVTLILDCDHRRIQFQHHRTNILVDLPVDLNHCPFPWKVVLRLDSEGDCVAIVH